MQCENCYCIFWKKSACILPEVSLDLRGCCRECVFWNTKDRFIKKKNSITSPKLSESAMNSKQE